MTHPRVYRYPGRVELTFPWRKYITPDLIETLKDEVPPRVRSYNPATKVWTVYHPWEEHAIGLLREAFPDATVYGADPYTRKEPPRRPEPRALANAHHYSVLCVTPAAPPEIVSAVYRAWCKLTHPDALPAPERDRATRRMQEVNAAYEALKAQGAA